MPAPWMKFWSLSVSSFHSSSCYAEMSMGISAAGPRNQESKSTMGQVRERVIGRTDCIKAKENKNNISTQISDQQGNERQELATNKRTRTAHGKL